MADEELYISDLPDSVTAVVSAGGSGATTAVQAPERDPLLAVSEGEPTTLAIGEEGDDE